RRFPHMPGVRDAWFVGLTPQNVAVVWLGQDEGAPFQGSGAQTASVWADYAQASLRGRIEGAFPEVEIEDEPIDDPQPEIDPAPELPAAQPPAESSPPPTGAAPAPAAENNTPPASGP
ncbi:MAG: hypothetical protein K1X75_17565, partial [Leptospirales bacterium]|nr:hypothetical protein [Leptospirales bacterium]